jgi:hypothetical protein
VLTATAPGRHNNAAKKVAKRNRRTATVNELEEE